MRLIDDARNTIRENLRVYMHLAHGLELTSDAAAVALEWAATRIARKEIDQLVENGLMPGTPDALARWVATAVTLSEAETIEAGVPPWFRTGLIGGLLVSFDAFIAGTADEADPEVVAMHDAAVKISTMFRGDVPPEVG